jgi:hypothetical protein
MLRLNMILLRSKGDLARLASFPQDANLCLLPELSGRELPLSGSRAPAVLIAWTTPVAGAAAALWDQNWPWPQKVVLGPESPVLDG